MHIRLGLQGYFMGEAGYGGAEICILALMGVGP